MVFIPRYIVSVLDVKKPTSQLLVMTKAIWKKNIFATHICNENLQDHTLYTATHVCVSKVC
jgi:hypothetical protein